MPDKLCYRLSDSLVQCLANYYRLSDSCVPDKLCYRLSDSRVPDKLCDRLSDSRVPDKLCYRLSDSWVQCLTNCVTG